MSAAAVTQGRAAARGPALRGRPVRVAVLGGGASSLAAAFELTRPEREGRFDVTVYQQGWRLGGKGASGRNARRAYRIEEHGLHIWFGFYERAFALVRDAYGELGADAPCVPWHEAFEPVPRLGLWEHGRELAVGLPAAPVAEREREPAPLEQVPSRLGRFLVGLWERDHAVGETAAPPEELVALAGDGPAVGHGGGLERAVTLLTGAAWRIDRIERDRGGGDVQQPHQPRRSTLSLLRRLCDFWAALLGGLVADGALRLPGGFDEEALQRIDAHDLRAWLSTRLLFADTAGAPFVNALYDLAFAYEDGDQLTPSVAAGVAARNIFRIAFEHRGCFMARLRGGMGDVVFAPLQRVLERRGVRFAFFSAVTRVGARPGWVDEIEIVPQVGLVRGTYEPLVELDGLPSTWPSKPLWAQLEDGDALAARAIDFEREADPLEREPLTLRRDQGDFDAAVLGIPVGALAAIGHDLAALDKGFARMLDSSATVATQALQLWLTAGAPELGLAGKRGSITGNWAKPLDTYSDTSHVIDLERWPAGHELAGVAYFCGVLADRDLRDPDQRVRQRAADDRVRGQAARFVAEHRGPLAAHLAGPQGRGGGSVDDQYSRANVLGGERYVRTPPGSTVHRLAPDGAAFENLVLAGDWTRTGVDAGSVEAAVISGELAAAALIRRAGAP